VRYDSGFFAAVYFNGAFNLNPQFFKVCADGGVRIRVARSPQAAMTPGVGLCSGHLSDTQEWRCPLRWLSSFLA